MKHPPSIIVVLLVLFLAAQFIGLGVLNQYVDQQLTEETGVVTYKDLPSGIERPEVEPNFAFVFITIAVVLGTVLMLVIMKFNKLGLWKIWYFFAVTATLAIAFAAFIPQTIAWLIALAASLLKVLRPNFIIHNLTELFIYSGLAAIFVPILNIFSASILLLLISVYDMYAVWKSKHMVALAKFQTSANMFAGLSVPKLSQFKATSTKLTKSTKNSTDNVAIIGGGDIGFPLMFAGVVMAQVGFQKAFIIPIFATLGLAVLFSISKKGKFYPAMPFVSAGCFLGYAIISVLP